MFHCGCGERGKSLSHSDALCDEDFAAVGTLESKEILDEFALLRNMALKPRGQASPRDLLQQHACTLLCLARSRENERGIIIV